MIGEYIEDENLDRLEFFKNIQGTFSLSFIDASGDLYRSPIMILDKDDAKLLVKRLNEFING